VTPEQQQQALNFLAQWAREAMPIKFVDQYNAAVVELGRLIEQCKPKPDAKPQAETEMSPSDGGG